MAWGGGATELYVMHTVVDILSKNIGYSGQFVAEENDSGESLSAGKRAESGHRLESLRECWRFLFGRCAA